MGDFLSALRGRPATNWTLIWQPIAVELTGGGARGFEVGLMTGNITLRHGPTANVVRLVYSTLGAGVSFSLLDLGTRGSSGGPSGPNQIPTGSPPLSNQGARLPNEARNLGSNLRLGERRAGAFSGLVPDLPGAVNLPSSAVVFQGGRSSGNDLQADDFAGWCTIVSIGLTLLPLSIGGVSGMTSYFMGQPLPMGLLLGPHAFVLPALVASSRAFVIQYAMGVSGFELPGGSAMVYGGNMSLWAGRWTS